MGKRWIQNENERESKGFTKRNERRGRESDIKTQGKKKRERKKKIKRNRKKSN